MKTPTELEQYLERLSKALGDVGTSVRAEIVTEIKSHVMDSQERNPEKSLSDLLEALGEPEQVANKFRLERGLSPVKPSRSPLVKWVTIGVLGSLGMFLGFVLVVLFAFTPLIEVNEKSGQVRLLGGLISVDEKSKTGIRVGGLSLDDDDLWQESEGFRDEQRIDLKKEPTTELVIEASNGKIEVVWSSENVLGWRCKVEGVEEGFVKERVGTTYKLDLSHTRGAKCHLTLPRNLKLQVKVQNGKVELIRPEGPTIVEVSNGVVALTPSLGRSYNYNLKVTNGVLDEFESSSDTKATAISVRVGNGRIWNESRD